MEMIKRNILFKPFLTEGISDGGIVIPDSCRKPTNKGIVFKVAADCKLKEGSIGFRVKDWGVEIILDGEQYFIMKEDAIIALE